MSKASKPLIPQPSIKSGDTTPKTDKPKEKLWSFSFRYWKQIQYFGLSHTNKEWLISVLERLHNLSREKLEDFQIDKGKKIKYRYHEIDWNQKNIPVKRKELDWIDSDYLNNEAEFPLRQFSIGKALGRIVGFFDEEQIFNIVLLDPLHNIQPSKDFAYKVDNCYPATGSYELLFNQLKKLKEQIQQSCKIDKSRSCVLHTSLETMHDCNVPFGVIILGKDNLDIIEASFADNVFESLGDLISYAAESALQLKQS